jgi:DNA-binding NtrC family response regulator
VSARRKGTDVKAEKKVLVVDDEPNAVRVLSMILKEDGYDTLEASNVDDAIGILRTKDVDAVITDLKMPAKDGFQLFEHVSAQYPDMPVMFLTAYGTVESAVDAMRSGAYYYFIKPPDYTQLKSVLARAIEQHIVKKEFANLKKSSQEKNVHSLIGKSPAILEIMKTIDTVKDTESSVLIQGETGTGKEVIASNLHYRGKRSGKPFVALNCAAIPRELMESELFGFEKGAFTGATMSRAGKFEDAAEGSIFLDEIGELDLAVQAKLLRVLQEREVERLGANKKTKVNFRLISSTNRDLKKEVAEGRFREDLFYRINVIQIEMPPLRDRKQDIPLLAMDFLNMFSLRADRPFKLSEDVLEIFQNYDWPGNIRQLRNIVERAVVLAKDDRITLRELPEEFHIHRKKANKTESTKTLKVIEHQAVKDALAMCSGNISKAAKQLGISRKTLYKRLKET